MKTGREQKERALYEPIVKELVQKQSGEITRRDKKRCERKETRQ